MTNSCVERGTRSQYSFPDINFLKFTVTCIDSGRCLCSRKDVVIIKCIYKQKWRRMLCFMYVGWSRRVALINRSGNGNQADKNGSANVNFMTAPVVFIHNHQSRPSTRRLLRSPALRTQASWRRLALHDLATSEAPSADSRQRPPRRCAHRSAMCRLSDISAALCWLPPYQQVSGEKLRRTSAV